MSPRTGRPTDNPKPYRLSVRVDEASKKILEQYTEQEKVSTMEAIRRGIKRLTSHIQNSYTTNPVRLDKSNYIIPPGKIKRKNRGGF